MWRKIVDDKARPEMERWQARHFMQEASIAERVVRIVKQGSEMPRPGLAGRPDAFYAAVAKAYVDAVQAGSAHAVKDAAATLGMSATKQSWAKVRNQLAAARYRGLLTKGTQGKQGGALTPAGIKALEENGDD